MPATLRLGAVVVVMAFGEAAHPVSYTSCGVTHTLQGSPQRAVTMNQGATELMLAMGLQDKMVGTAYLDDEIWPRYASAYAGIPVLSTSYPSEEEIMAVSPDFILGSLKSAFREKTCTDMRCRGIFSYATIGPCNGAGSDFFESGSNASTLYSTCRPQLHAAGIGTWLDPESCEDADLKPTGGATEETVYAAIEQVGKIFNVPSIASALIAEIRSDFTTAKANRAGSGHTITAVWLDCIDFCCNDEDGNPDPNRLFVGGGAGAPNLIMQASGFTNPFANSGDTWTCVAVSDVLAADPDVVIIVDAAWETALSKIDFLHNRTQSCGARFIEEADYIKIPFSTSMSGPRSGAAALDLVSAAIHLTTGSTRTNFQSGVDFFDPEVLANRTASLRCPVNLEQVRYSAAYQQSSSSRSTSTTSTAPGSNQTTPERVDRAPEPEPWGEQLSDRAPAPESELPAWGVALIVVFSVLRSLRHVQV